MCPQNSISTEYVAPVSKRKETDCSETVMSTCGSLVEMVFMSEEHRHPQFSTARPGRSVGGWYVSDVSMS